MWLARLGQSSGQLGDATNIFVVGVVRTHGWRTEGARSELRKGGGGGGHRVSGAVRSNAAGDVSGNQGSVPLTRLCGSFELQRTHTDYVRVEVPKWFGSGRTSCQQGHNEAGS